MRISRTILLVISQIVLLACAQTHSTKTTSGNYFDKSKQDTLIQGVLIAVTNEEYLQYGAPVAYINERCDTVIPFGKYAYLGTDTLKHFACVIDYSNDGSYGKWLAIDSEQNTLFDIVSFDNGPDYFQEGLVRVKRNGKMGYANQYGQVIIPCRYDFAWWFENGLAKVTLDAEVVKNKYDEHSRVEADEWFYIDKHGNRLD
ncbi:WG repeat-containing protein [Carboxylicivirga taeanensis]|uniref:WG repeat-containing protein n=1 Tax=Carboxylicivirga taeanensis TaxID=1416875 RepID=UPI003F6DE219